MSRKKKYTAEQMIKAIESAQGVLANAARILGCSRTTVHSYINEYKTVAAAYHEINDANMDRAEGYLMALVTDRKHKDHFNALRFYLRTKGKERGYVERQEVAGVKDQPVNITLVPAKDGD